MKNKLENTNSQKKILADIITNKLKLIIILVFLLFLIFFFILMIIIFPKSLINLEGNEFCPKNKNLSLYKNYCKKLDLNKSNFWSSLFSFTSDDLFFSIDLKTKRKNKKNFEIYKIFYRYQIMYDNNEKNNNQENKIKNNENINQKNQKNNNKDNNQNNNENLNQKNYLIKNNENLNQNDNENINQNNYLIKNDNENVNNDDDNGMNNIFVDPIIKKYDYQQPKEYSIEIKCEKNKECEKMNIIFYKNLKNKNYRILIHLDIEEKIASNFDYFEFNLFKGNKKQKKILKIINIIFFIFSILLFFIYLQNYLKTKKNQKTFLHKKITLLSISLIFYNFPIFLLNLIKINQIEIILESIYKTQLLILLLYIWLIVFKMIIDKKKIINNYLYGYKIKILCFSLFISFLIFLNFYYSKNNHYYFFLGKKNFNILFIMFFVISSILFFIYFFWFLNFLFKIKEKKISLSKRDQFFLVFSIFGFILFFFYFFKGVDQHNKFFFIFETTFDCFINIYIFILQICWLFQKDYFYKNNKELAKINHKENEFKETEQQIIKSNIDLEKNNENTFSEFKITDESIE